MASGADRAGGSDPPAPEERQSSIPVEEIDGAEGVYRLFLGGDCAEALALARRVLAEHPGDPMASTVAALCERQLLSSSAEPSIAAGTEQPASLDPVAAWIDADRTPRSS